MMYAMNIDAGIDGVKALASIKAAASSVIRSLASSGMRGLVWNSIKRHKSGRLCARRVPQFHVACVVQSASKICS